MSKVNSLEETFHGCTNLTSLDLTGWGEGDNLANVTNMTKTFRGLENLPKITIGSDEVWDLKNVTIMRTTFENCKKINMDFGFIHLSNKLTFISWTFKNCSNITTLDLSNGDTTSVTTNMEDTFDGCSKLKTIYVSDKFVITQKKSMFPGCTSLVGGKGTSYSDILNANDVNEAKNSKYAKIDGGADDPGYFTLKE
jgi:surface protein